MAVNPRRMSRPRNCFRPRARRLRTVPTGHPRCRALLHRYDPRDRIARLVRGSGSGAGRPLPEAAPARSSELSQRGRPLPCSAAFRSWNRCRVPAILARPAARHATRCSQGPSESLTQSDPPLLRSTRNVAWNASMASCSSLRMLRQVRKTIGPCRSTIAANASSAALTTMGRKPFEELPVRQAGGDPHAEQRTEMQPGNSTRFMCHSQRLPPRSLDATCSKASRSPKSSNDFRCHLRKGQTVQKSCGPARVAQPSDCVAVMTRHFKDKDATWRFEKKQRGALPLSMNCRESQVCLALVHGRWFAAADGSALLPLHQ